MNKKRARPGMGDRAEYKQGWYFANKAKIAARHREYRRRNREEILAQKRRYYQKHREEILAWRRKKFGFKPWHPGGRGRPPKDY